MCLVDIFWFLSRVWKFIQCAKIYRFIYIDGKFEYLANMYKTCTNTSGPDP